MPVAIGQGCYAGGRATETVQKGCSALCLVGEGNATLSYVQCGSGTVGCVGWACRGVRSGGPGPMNKSVFLRLSVSWHVMSGVTGLPDCSVIKERGRQRCPLTGGRRGNGEETKGDEENHNSFGLRVNLQHYFRVRYPWAAFCCRGVRGSKMMQRRGIVWGREESCQMWADGNAWREAVTSLLNKKTATQNQREISV